MKNWKVLVLTIRTNYGVYKKLFYQLELKNLVLHYLLPPYDMWGGEQEISRNKSLWLGKLSAVPLVESADSTSIQVGTLTRASRRGQMALQQKRECRGIRKHTASMLTVTGGNAGRDARRPVPTEAPAIKQRGWTDGLLCVKGALPPAWSNDKLFWGDSRPWDGNSGLPSGGRRSSTSTAKRLYCKVPIRKSRIWNSSVSQSAGHFTNDPTIAAPATEQAFKHSPSPWTNKWIN